MEKKLLLKKVAFFGFVANKQALDKLSKLPSYLVEKILETAKEKITKPFLTGEIVDKIVKEVMEKGKRIDIEVRPLPKSKQQKKIEINDVVDYLLRRYQKISAFLFNRIELANLISIGKIKGKISKIQEGKVIYKDRVIVSADEIKLEGHHNLENILAVVNVAKLLEIDNETIKTALIKFNPIEHRLEFVGTFRGIDFYNDAISTTPESTIAAIKAMKKPISTIILGGLDRGYDFDLLAQEILQAAIPNIILFPGSGSRIWQAIEKFSGEELPRKMEVSSMSDCVSACFKFSKLDTVCLLSTASPSYGMFENFEEKGRQFKELVRAYIPQH